MVSVGAPGDELSHDPPLWLCAGSAGGFEKYVPCVCGVCDFVLRRVSDPAVGAG